ncbi:MAG: serine/threonine-protein kinase, partial [Planctomycetota bacterium]
MSISLGDRLDGRYEVLEVHSGGMGVVFVVHDLESGEKYAAKTTKEDLRDDDRVRSRFEREVRTWIRLGHHENLVEALFVKDLDGAPFLFLEYVDGPTLAALLKADGPLLLAQAVDIALMCALGLTHAQEQAVGLGAEGLVHRDVKPENVFLTRTRQAKVSDLGIAKVLSADLDATAEGVGMGTPFYVSPEQLKSAREVDGRADVYSFAAVLYEMLTGELPLRAESLESQIYQILRVRPEPPSTVSSRVPSALDELLLRCLEKDPERRPAGFRPVADALAALLADPTFLALESPGASCPSCGYGSLRAPESCPVCAASMGPPVRYRPRAAVEAPAPRVSAPARLFVTGVEVCPRAVRVGEMMAV